MISSIEKISQGYAHICFGWIDSKSITIFPTKKKKKSEENKNQKKRGDKEGEKQRLQDSSDKYSMTRDNKSWKKMALKNISLFPCVCGTMGLLDGLSQWYQLSWKLALL